jgi:O-succinylbenzoate synthase
MRIEAVDLYHVAMPLKARWRTAASEETAIQSVIVRLQTDAGIGWAETAPHRAPLYSPEWASGTFAVLRDWLAPAVLGARVACGDDLQDLLRAFKGHQFAKAGLDVAWWDAAGRAQRQPVWRLIGGRGDPVAVGADLGVEETFDALLAAVQGCVDAGFRRVKLKARRGWALEVVQAVRAAFPRLRIHIDCNSGFTLDDLDMFRALDRYDLAMIEQPLAHDDLLDHAELQKRLDTPICLDESITGVDRARHAIALGSCRWINIKVGRVGGLTPALQVHRVCRDAGVPNWMGNMLESALGQAPALAMATLDNMDYPSDIFPSVRFYEHDLASPPIELSGRSQITPSLEPGFGVEPVPERLAAMTRQHASLTPFQRDGSPTATP